MIQYLNIFAILILLAYVKTFVHQSQIKTVNKKQKLHTYTSVFIIVSTLALFAGSRYQSGYDWRSYSIEFENFVLGSSDSRFEPGFQFFMRLASNLGLTFNGLLVVVALVSIGLIIFSIFVISPYPYLSLLVFYGNIYFQSNFALLRQGLAISIFSLALLTVINKQLIYYLVLIFVASLFHRSALILFMLWPLLRFNGKLYWYYITIFAAIVLFVIRWLPNIVLPLSEAFLPSIVTRMLVSYLGRAEIAGLTLSLIEKSVFFSVGVFLFNRFTKEDKIVFNLLFLDLLFMILFNNYLILQQRIGLYLRISTIYFIPTLYKYAPVKYKGLIYFAIVLHSLVWLYSTVLSKEAYVPYQSFV